MIIKIHRGTNQIGGCITEIATNGTRIIIDMGANLDCELEKSKVDIAGLTTGIKSCDAVFFTHYHSDHLGLYKTILPNIPLYIGEVAKDIFQPDKLNLAVIGPFEEKDSERLKGLLNL